MARYLPANFKRGNGDNMGVAGGLNDRAVYTAPVTSFYPNSFGIYNMSGNVSEWTGDVYRPLSPTDNDDVSPYRGNRYQNVFKNKDGEFEKDSMGRVKTVYVTDEESKTAVTIRKVTLSTILMVTLWSAVLDMVILISKRTKQMAVVTDKLLWSAINHVWLKVVAGTTVLIG